MPRVPIKFQIFKGDELLREEVLTEAVIKVGKLASSHLRLDDETVSRMHAVIEINGAEDVQLIDLGSTRGTTVNGERTTKAHLKSGDEVAFGDVRVVVTVLDEAAAAAAARPTPPPPVAAVAPPRPPVPAPFGPPPQVFAAPSAAAFAMPMSMSGANPVAAEVEEHDGTRAVEVQAIFRGVVINTRHLFDGTAQDRSKQAQTMLIAGIAAMALGVVAFLFTVFDVGSEKDSHERWLAEKKEAKAFVWKHRTAVPDIIVFGGAGLGMALVYMGLKRRSKNNPRYVIGADVDADAPVPAEYIGGSSFALVSPAGGEFAVHVTPQMKGEVIIDNTLTPLQQYVQQRGATFSLPEGGRAKLDCGDTTFLVTGTPKPRVLDVPFLNWKWNEASYFVGTMVGLALFLIMIFSVPPDPKSLSLDLFNADNRFLNFLIKPPEEKEEEIPEWLKKNNSDEQGGKGKRHKGDEGQMGKKDSKKKEGLFGLKGPKDNPDPHLAKKLAEEQAKNAGILGVLKMNEGSHLASIFGRDTALGSDAENVLGGLIGNQIGEAYGVGGLGLVGTGSGGGGTGEGTIGLGNLGTIGKGGGGGNGSGYGRGAGGLGGRRASAPDVIPGQANVRGSLDKEIIRRIIRRHINEVKYCYDQELQRKPDLGGRITVQFTISPNGAVATSVLQQSTVGNPRVENCIVQAVRRWEFPKPLGGGIVIVSYPFVLNAAGGGGEGK